MSDIAPAPPAFDQSLLDEPGYQTALDELLSALQADPSGAYETLARRYPRYAPPLLEAALIALPAERRLAQAPPTILRETAAPYAVRQAVADGITSARRTLEGEEEVLGVRC